MTEPFFPFRIYSDRLNGHCPHGFSESFHNNKPEFIEIIHAKGTKYEWVYREKFSYYCYDVIVHSQTVIEFICFDMEPFSYGGKGEEICRFKAVVEKSVTKDSIVRRLDHRAVSRREKELEEAEDKLIQGYANEEAKELNLKGI